MAGLIINNDILISEKMINKLILESDKKKHPIGSLEFNISGTNPKEYLEFGEWELWGSGKVPVGIDISDKDFDEVEKTGGEKTHILTNAEIPAHTHQGNIGGAQAINGGGAGWTKFVGTTSPYTTGASGGDQPHNNLQPYIVCYMWKRVS